LNLPPPSTFGLPSKFIAWRKNQAEACQSIIDSEERFLLQVCPTGSGKSITYVTASQLISGRTVILTSTKGLQTQLMADFGRMPGVVDIRGRGNYPCRMNSQVNCDIGPCVFGVKCSMKEEGGCFYFDQVKKARKFAKVVITNYAYWMSQNEFSDGLGPFDMLILDEAHSAPDHINDHISVSFNKKNKMENRMLDLDGSLPNNCESWSMWASEKLQDVQLDMETAKVNRKEKLYLALKRIAEKLKRLDGSMDNTWLWEDNPESVILSPVWPARFSEAVLFLGVPKVVLTSATVVPKTAKLLGIPTESVKFEEYPHSFPVENRPLIHVPTVRLNYKVGDMENRLWLNRVDQIIRPRLGTKGIIHTVSYARRDMVIQHSSFSEHMITHNRADTEDVIRGFKRSEAPAILVSPSMATGWDFPDDECRWQVIIKLPYPDTRGTIMRERSKRDSEFTAYITMQQLIQATGRGTRSQGDWCETFILDNNIVWFLTKYRNLSVDWFDGAYRVSKTVPLPLNNQMEEISYE